MSDVHGSIESGGRTYKIMYSLGVMERIQEKYGSFQTWADKLQVESEGAHALAFGLSAMIEAGEGNPCSERKALKILAVGDSTEIIKEVVETISLSVRDEEATVRLIPDEPDEEKSNFEWYKLIGTARLGYATHSEVMAHTLTYFNRLYRAYQKLFDLESALMMGEESYQSLEEKNENEELWLPL